MKQQLTSHSRTRYNSVLHYLSLFTVIFTSLILICNFLKGYDHAIFQVALFFTGWLSWTFFEYMSHRYLMHGSKKEKSLVDFNHMHHHSHPTEIKLSGWQRSLLILGFILLLSVSIRLDNYFTIAAGFLCGFPVYSVMHFLLHQKATQKIFKKLVKYHIYHHCRYYDKCYGISVTWWDDMFRTVPDNPPPISQRIINFYFSKKGAI